MSSIFDIERAKLILWQLPTFLRTRVRVAWLQVLTMPLDGIRNMLMRFREESLYKLDHTGQVILLQAVLNDRFDSVQRRIYIENQRIYEPVWIYDYADGRPVYHYDAADGRPVYYYDRADYETLYPDFIVYVPGDLRPADTQEEAELLRRMSVLIDYYKLYSKNYQIVWTN